MYWQKLKVRGLNWQNWKLEDWYEKEWKLEGQFYIFAFVKLHIHIHILIHFYIFWLNKSFIEWEEQYYKIFVRIYIYISFCVSLSILCHVTAIGSTCTTRVSYNQLTTRVVRDTYIFNYHFDAHIWEEIQDK